MKRYWLLCNNNLAKGIGVIAEDIYFFPRGPVETLLPGIPVDRVFFERQTKGDNKVTYKFPEKFTSNLWLTSPVFQIINWFLTLLLENFYEVGLDNTNQESEWVS